MCFALQAFVWQLSAVSQGCVVRAAPPPRVRARATQRRHLPPPRHCGPRKRCVVAPAGPRASGTSSSVRCKNCCTRNAIASPPPPPDLDRGCSRCDRQHAPRRTDDTAAVGFLKHGDVQARAPKATAAACHPPGIVWVRWARASPQSRWESRCARSLSLNDDALTHPRALALVCGCCGHPVAMNSSSAVLIHSAHERGRVRGLTGCGA